MKLRSPLFDPAEDNPIGAVGDVWDEPPIDESQNEGGQAVPPPNVQPLKPSTPNAPETPPTPAPQVIQMEKGQLSGELADALRAVMPQQSQAPNNTTQISDADWAKLTHHYSVPPEQVVELFGNPPEGLDEKAAALWIEQKQKGLQRLVDGSSKHAIAVSRLATGADLKGISSRIEPIVAERQRAELETFHDSMVSTNPVLKALPNGAGKQMIKLAIESLRQDRFMPKSEEEGKKAIYDRVEQIARNVNPNFTLGQTSNTGANRASGMTGSVNGGGGSGQQGKQKQSANAAVAIYD